MEKRYTVRAMGSNTSEKGTETTMETEKDIETEKDVEMPVATELAAPEPEKKKKDKRGLVILLLLLLLLLMAGTLIWVFFLRGTPEAELPETDDFFDPMAQTGILPDMSEDQIREELNRVVEEGMLNIAISGEIVFQDGESQGKVNISNTQANHYIFKVLITQDDTGDVLYESRGISPGQYIQYITLEKDLDAGEYAATATFTAYTQDTHEVVGSAAAKITLYVLA